MDSENNLRKITYSKEAFVVDGINGHSYDAQILRLALGCILTSRMFTKYPDWAQIEYFAETGIPLKGILIDALGRTLFEDLLEGGFIIWCGEPLESSISLTPSGENLYAHISLFNAPQPIS